MQLLFVFLITSDQLAIRKLFNPVTERMPLVELVVPPAFVNISQNLIIQHDRPSLVVRAREELDHLPPDLVLTHVLDNIANLMTYRENAIFEIGIFDVAPTIDIQNINRLLQMLIGRIDEMLMTKIFRLKLLRVDLMHCRARVRNCPNFIF